MTVRLRFLDNNDRKWYVEAGGFPDAVIVPLDTIDGMTAEEIGTMVLSLTPEIDYGHAVLLLDKYHQRQLKEDFYEADELQRDLEQCEKYSEREPELGKLAVVLRNLLDRKLRKVSTSSQKKKQMRDELAVVYEQRFVEIGRRDGFKCCACGSTSPNLQIDHVMPISLGGNNDLDNLCLMCPSCNQKKGTTSHETFLKQAGALA